MGQTLEHVIWVSDKSRHDWKRFIEFVQHQANRLGYGYHQYEAKNKGVSSTQRYFDRLELEVKAYKKTGNREHLLNIANYSWLESRAPQNKKFHWDNSVDSVTRGKVG